MCSQDIPLYPDLILFPSRRHFSCLLLLQSYPVSAGLLWSVLIFLTIQTNSYISPQLRQKSETHWAFFLCSCSSPCWCNHLMITPLGLFSHSFQKGFYLSTQAALSFTFITSWALLNNTSTESCSRALRQDFDTGKCIRTMRGAACPALLRKYWLSLCHQYWLSEPRLVIIIPILMLHPRCMRDVNTLHPARHPGSVALSSPGFVWCICVPNASRVFLCASMCTRGGVLFGIITPDEWGVCFADRGSQYHLATLAICFTPHTHTHTQNGGNQWDDLVASVLCPQGVNSICCYI